MRVFLSQYNDLKPDVELETMIIPPFWHEILTLGVCFITNTSAFDVSASERVDSTSLQICLASIDLAISRHEVFNALVLRICHFHALFY